MPLLDLSDEELQGLITLCATGSGPGITWMLTNAILTKAQQAAQNKPPQTPAKPRRHVPPGDGLDLEPIPRLPE